MEQTRIFGVMVVYNSDVSKSITFNNIMNSDLDYCYLIVVDNSTKETNNSEFCKRDRCYYIETGKNAGLSKGLNIGIDYIFNNLDIRESDLIVQLNDDTGVNSEYFELLKKFAQDHKESDIFAPVMQGQDGVLYSPAYNNFLRHGRIKKPNEVVPQDRFMCIASATASRKKVFDNYRFDEGIFMDLIDNNFCDDQRALGRRFETLPIVIQQNLALKNPNLTFERIQNRYKIWIPDFLYYCRKKKSRLWGYFPAVAGRGIMLSMKCKNPYFFFWSLGYSIECLFKKGKKQ